MRRRPVGVASVTYRKRTEVKHVALQKKHVLMLYLHYRKSSSRLAILLQQKSWSRYNATMKSYRQGNMCIYQVNNVHSCKARWMSSRPICRNLLKSTAKIFEKIQPFVLIFNACVPILAWILLRVQYILSDNHMLQVINLSTTANKGFWADLLGVGDFYYELGIQIIEACIVSRINDGGLTELSEIMRRVQVMRGSNNKQQQQQQISEDDIVRAIKTLKPLSGGYEVLPIGDRKLVRSVPKELDKDQSALLLLAQVGLRFDHDAAMETH